MGLFFLSGYNVLHFIFEKSIYTQSRKRLNSFTTIHMRMLFYSYLFKTFHWCCVMFFFLFWFCSAMLIIGQNLNHHGYNLWNIGEWPICREQSCSCSMRSVLYPSFRSLLAFEIQEQVTAINHLANILVTGMHD